MGNGKVERNSSMIKAAQPRLHKDRAFARRVRSAISQVWLWLVARQGQTRPACEPIVGLQGYDVQN